MKPLGLLVAIAAALVLPASASAAPTWLSPIDVAPAQTANTVSGDVVIDDSGNVVAAYIQEDPAPCGVCADQVWVAERPAGGSFGQRKQLSQDDQNANSVSLGVNARGDVVAVWNEVVGGNTIARYAVKPAGGSWSTSADLSGGGQSVNNFPTVALAPDGTAVAAWDRFNGSNVIVQASVKPAGSTSFGAVSDLSPLGVDSGGPRVAMDDAGNALIGWRTDGACDGGCANGIRVTSRPAGGSFTTLDPIHQVADPDHVDGPRIQLAPGGRATILWAHYVSAAGAHRVLSSSRGLTGQFNPVPDVVSDPTIDSGNAGSLDIAVDKEDNAVAAWSADVVTGAARKSNASFLAPSPISGPGVGAFDPALGFDGAGTAHIGFQGFAGNTTIQAAARPRDSVFGAVTDIESSPTGGFLTGPTPLDVNDAGDGVIGYERGLSTGEQAMRVAGYDGAAPKQANVNVPDRAGTGASVPMSVAVSDTWSSFTTKWTFGDGGEATGASVSHAYAGPGTYTVNVTSTDAVGNSSSATRTIQVFIPDADADGSPDDQDCDDGNPNIRPGIADRPGNGIDEDCAGGDAKVQIDTGLRNGWRAFDKFTTVNELTLTKVVGGTKAVVRCKGKGCPLKKKTIRFKKNKSRHVLTKLFNRRKKGKRRVAKLRVGTQVSVHVTGADVFGRFFIYKMRSSKVPKSTVGCLQVNSQNRRACP